MSSDYREQARVTAESWVIDKATSEILTGKDLNRLITAIAAALVAAHAAGLEAGAVIAEADDFEHTSGYRCRRGRAIADSIRSTAIRTAAAKGETDDS